jgi:molybdopterin-guanine dinucleotide biosynthesis protein B
LPVYTEVEPLAELVLQQGFLLPGLDCSACGYATCGELARSIVSGGDSEGSCQAVPSDLEILVNGQPLALNPFVRQLISGTLTGMLSSLKGYAPGPVTIRMEPGR